MAVARELPGGAQYRNRVDAGMHCKSLILGRDQHLPIQRVDLIGAERQPPFAVGAQKPAQDRTVARQHEAGQLLAALHPGWRQRTISAREHRQTDDADKNPPPNAVIPGGPEGPGPESMNTSRDGRRPALELS